MGGSDSVLEERRLAERLVATGRLSVAQLRACISIQQARGGPGSCSLGAVMRELGIDPGADALAAAAAAGAPAAAPIDPANYEDGAPTVVLGPKSDAPAPGAAGDGDVPFSATSAVRAGDRIGRFIVEGVLGIGGMGAVYLCLDPRLRRRVAVKLIRSAALRSETYRRRFVREAQAVARLSHPGIVPLHEMSDEEEHERPFLVMEYVPGESLQARIGRGALAPLEAARIGRDVARALAYAHAQGVVHRDVKPHNVLLDASGAPRLTDFGLARDTEAGSRITEKGACLGTPEFMAPEQLSGDPDAAGPAADVYGLGALLYQAIAGRPPFESPGVAGLIKKVIFEAPAPLATHAPGTPRARRGRDALPREGARGALRLGRRARRRPRRPAPGERLGRRARRRGRRRARERRTRRAVARGGPARRARHRRRRARRRRRGLGAPAGRRRRVRSGNGAGAPRTRAEEPPPSPAPTPAAPAPAKAPDADAPTGSRGDAELEAEPDFSVASRLFHQRRYDELIPIMEGLVARYPRSVHGLINLAIAHRGAGDHEAALATLERALAIDPVDPELYHLRGHEHESLGRLERARADLRRAIHLGHPNREELLDDLAHLGE